MKTPRPIKFADIRKGDRIRRTYVSGDCTYTIEGVAQIQGGEDWSTDNDQLLARDYYKSQTLELIDRPKPPLPTTPGALILVTQACNVVMGNPLPMFLSFDGTWVSIPYGGVYRPEKIQDWEPVTVTGDS